MTIPGSKPAPLSRRALLRRIALLCGAAAGSSLAGCAQTARKGPAVWLDMDQQALDDAYSQFKYAPNIGQVIDRWASNSDLVRGRLGEPERFRYGAGPAESLDVYRADATDAPTLIFIHGGAWQEGTASLYGFPAECFVNAGVHYVVPDFSWIQDVGDSLYPIVDQLRRVIAWVYGNAGRFGGDAEQLFLAGHSSGAHLAGVMLTTDWPGSAGLPADVIKGGTCCSGMFDLEPVRLSSRGDYIAFTDAMEADLSPIRHLDHLEAPLIVAFGSYETPEFQRQARAFAAAIAAAGKEVTLLVGENYNHFEIIETLANPYGILGRAVLGQIRQR